jgi:hypothetical protein
VHDQILGIIYGLIFVIKRIWIVAQAFGFKGKWLTKRKMFFSKIINRINDSWYMKLLNKSMVFLNLKIMYIPGIFELRLEERYLGFTYFKEIIINV